MNFKTKLVGVIAAFTLVVTPAIAMSTAELINLLVSMGLISADQVALVNAAVGGTTAAPSADCAALKAAPNMTLESQGANVTMLQNWLISGGYSIPAGATGYFGGQTQAALAQYQTAMGITPAAGYFGPITRASIVCAPAVVAPTTPTTPTTPVVSGDEADVRGITVRSEEDASADSRDQKVASFEIDLGRNSGDIVLNRVDIKVAATSTVAGEDRLFRIFDAISIADSTGKVIGSQRTTSRNDWRDGDTVRIAGMNTVVKGDARTTFYVLVDTARLSEADLDITAGLSVDSIRYTEATGAIVTDNIIAGNPAEFVIEGEESADLRLRSSVNNPDASIVKGDSDSDTREVTANVFTLESRKLDFFVEEIDVQVYYNNGTSTVGTIARRAELYRGSTRIDTRTVPANGLVTFDLRDYELRADRSEEFSVRLDLNRIDGSTLVDNQTFQVNVVAVRGYDENDADKNLTTSVAVGKTHTFSLSAATIDQFNWAPNNVGTIIDFTFNVEAVDEDFTVNVASIQAVESVSGTASTTVQSPILTVTGGDALVVTAGSVYTVEAGRTATFRVRYASTATSTDNGKYWEVKIPTVEGQTVPNNKQTSPTATINIQ